MSQCQIWTECTCFLYCCYSIFLGFLRSGNRNSELEHAMISPYLIIYAVSRLCPQIPYPDLSCHQLSIISWNNFGSSSSIIPESRTIYQTSCRLCCIESLCCVFASPYFHINRTNNTHCCACLRQCLMGSLIVNVSYRLSHSLFVQVYMKNWGNRN